MTMGTGRFDRLRPRTSEADVAPSAHDTEGKRALFSTTHGALPAGGFVVVDCARCSRRTVLAPVAALRAAFPSLHFAIGIGRGDKESTLGLSRRHFGSLMRCPACGQVSWVRVTLRF